MLFCTTVLLEVLASSHCFNSLSLACSRLPVREAQGQLTDHMKCKTSCDSCTPAFTKHVIDSMAFQQNAKALAWFLALLGLSDHIS